MSNRLRVGMVGYKFMGKAHSNAYRSLPMFFPSAPLQPEMSVICGRNEQGVQEAANQFGWSESVTDWRELVKRDDIDLIDINAPSDAHKEIALEAARQGKHLFVRNHLLCPSRIRVRCFRPQRRPESLIWSGSTIVSHQQCN